MSDLTDGAETRTLAWLLGQPTTAPVMPLRVQLMAANGTDATPGVEVTGGTYVAQPLNAASVVNGASANTAVVRFEGIPSPTSVAGVEIRDAAGFRWWARAFPAPRNVVDGVAEFGIGDLGLTLG